MLLLLFFDSDKAIGLPWCNIGHFHCYCYIFFDWEDGNVTIFLTNFMLLWHYFGQFTTIVTIFLDTRSAIVTNVGHFYCYCYFFFDGVDGNVTLFLTKFMLLWHYFGQFTTNVTYFLTLELLSWQTWDISIAIVIFFCRWKKEEGEEQLYFCRLQKPWKLAAA